MSSSKDPYAAGKFISNPYACKNDIIGKWSLRWTENWKTGAYL